MSISRFIPYRCREKRLQDRLPPVSEGSTGLANVDVIIIARGGGSLEELWAFNEEIVARSIYESKIPVISAVGHETDFTIADFVADVRASTPSAAAELVMPERTLLENRLDSLKMRLRNAAVQRTAMDRMKLKRLIG